MALIKGKEVVRSPLLFYLLAIIAVFLVKTNVFFWDTIQLGAKQATWFYTNGFRHLLLPPEIDSGHPPAFGMYLAAAWQLFGRSLPVSHWAMLPFLIGIIFSVARLTPYLAGPRTAPACLLLLLFADPALAAQSLLISPDLVLVLGFLAGLYGILSDRPWWLAFGAVLLALISTRGMMIALALYLFCLWRLYLPGAPAPRRPLWSLIWRQALPFVPGGLLATAFLGYHYVQSGWIGYHPDSPWAPSFGRVDGPEFLFNVGVLGWRLLDYGRVLIWLPVLYLAWKRWRKEGFSYQQWQMLSLLALLLLMLTPTLLLHQHLLNHRYLLPVFITLNLLFFTLLPAMSEPSHRTTLYMLAIAGLLTGNCWIYPRHIAQGWDSTLAHLPHYELRQRILQVLDREAIPYRLVGTAFPEIGPLDVRDLSGRSEGFSAKDLATQRYIYFSNIMNDFSDAELRALDRDWEPIARFDRGGVCAMLYRRRTANEK